MSEFNPFGGLVSQITQPKMAKAPVRPVARKKIGGANRTWRPSVLQYLETHETVNAHTLWDVFPDIRNTSDVLSGMRREGLLVCCRREPNQPWEYTLPERAADVGPSNSIIDRLERVFAANPYITAMSLIELSRAIRSRPDRVKEAVDNAMATGRFVGVEFQAITFRPAGKPRAGA